jgi:hypothetical protein
MTTSPDHLRGLGRPSDAQASFGYETGMTTPQEPLPDLDQDVEQGQDEEQSQDQNPEPSTSDGVIPTEQELDPEGKESAAFLDGDPGQ